MSKLTYIRRAAILLVAASLASGCITPPEEDPVLIKLDQIDQRVDNIERVVQNESLLEIAREIEALRAEVRTLRGQVETLQYETEGAGTRQRDQYLDLDQRLQAIERGTRQVVPATGDAAAGAGAAIAAGAAAGTAGAAAAGGLPVPGGDDRQNYQAALELLKQGRYPQAEAAFSEFLVAFPTSELADNAQYWLGETYYVGRNFEAALAAFQVVLDKYPDSRKTADALLKLGFCNYELKRWADARAALEDVTARFADTTAARLAAQRLEKMRSEGH